MRNRYWHSRLERWGAWRVGAYGVTVAPWARMRNGMPMSNSEERLPELHLEERETEELVGKMPREQSALLRRIYPWQAGIASKIGLARQTLDARIHVLHCTLARMLDQRRRGEAVDAERRRPRLPVARVSARIKGRRVTLASTQHEK